MASFSPFSHCKSKQLQRRVEQLFGWIFIRDHRVVGNLEASLGQEEPESLASFKSIRCAYGLLDICGICAYMQLSSRHVVQTPGNSQGQVLTASLGFCNCVAIGNAGANTLKASCQIVKARWESNPKIKFRKFRLAVESCEQNNRSSPAVSSPPNVLSCLYTETLCMLLAHQACTNALPSHTTS